AGKAHRFYDEKRLLRLALAEAERFGEHDPRVLKSLHDIVAREYYNYAPLNPAALEKYARRLLAFQEVTLGPNHPDLLWTIDKLAFACSFSDEEGEREALYK